MRDNPDVARGPAFRTKRLVLRGWRPDDLAPFAEMNGDPEVMRYFPALLTLDETAALIERIEESFRAHGYGLWAVEIKGGGQFAGFVGLSPVAEPFPFAPAVEVGWRLGRAHWGQGLATEAARASLGFGFDEVGLHEIVSFTSVINDPSRRVMKRLGMTHNPDEDFNHPWLPVGHPLRPHVLYRIVSSDFAAASIRLLSGQPQIDVRSSDDEPGTAVRDDRARDLDASQTGCNRAELDVCPPDFNHHLGSHRRGAQSRS